MVDVLKLRAIRKEWCNVLDQIARVRGKLNKERALHPKYVSYLEKRLSILNSRADYLESKLAKLEPEYTKDIQESIRRNANGKPITSRTNVFGTWTPDRGSK